MENMSVIDAVRVTKAYGSVKALTGASLSARPGEVHALVGENGAGKSTLVKMLSGLVSPDSGEIRVNREAVKLHGAAAARAAGIGTVFQELSLLPDMTVADNLLIGREARNRFGLISQRKKLRVAQQELDNAQLSHIDAGALVGSLPLQQQQLIEIAKVIRRQPRVLVLDEATSALGEDAVEWLFRAVRRLRDEGVAVLFTSHRWNEVTAISDWMTVFRNGHDVESSPAADIDERQAINLMTGREVDTLYPKLSTVPSRQPSVEAKGLVAGQIRGVDFKLHKGEILGVGGLAGQGQLDLFLAMFGARPRTGGEVLIDGKAARLRSPREAVQKHKIALVPEDRKREGLILPMSIQTNLTLPILNTFSRAGYIDRRREREQAAGVIKTLAVRTPSAQQPVGALSGGNQQKVLLGRWLLAEAQVLLMYDVTRGVDIATKHDIYELIVWLASKGRSILFYSSDTEELARLCHRVMVLREGKISRELQGDGITNEALVEAALGLGASGSTLGEVSSDGRVAPC
jgi:ribose transport system ATP-binding protein